MLQPAEPPNQSKWIEVKFNHFKILRSKLHWKIFATTLKYKYVFLRKSYIFLNALESKYLKCKASIFYVIEDWHFYKKYKSAKWVHCAYS